jgi:hypothetical protein
VHVPPPTTEKVMHVLLSSDSPSFILIDFRLFDYPLQSLSHLDVTNFFIDKKKSDIIINSTTHLEIMWAPLSIPILSDVIWFLLPFNFNWIFYARSVFHNSTEFCSLLVGEQDNENNLVGGATEKNPLNKLNFLI